MKGLNFGYPDTLQELNKNISLSDKVRAIHKVVEERIGGIERISAAIYDPKTDLVKTFVDSSGAAQPLVHYQAKLSESHSLHEVFATGQSRVVNDLAVFAGGPHYHTQQMADQGYRSSYTMPM